MHPQDTPSTIPTFANGIAHYVVDDAGCWLWQGRLRPDGHGGIDIKGMTTLAHRYYYMLYVGPIPAGRYLHHTCHVAWCVNPAHMQVVTPEQHGIYRHPGQLGQPATAPPPRPVLSVEQQRALAEQRFWSHVEKTETCWLYGVGPARDKPQFWLNGRYVRASRLAYEWYVGPIPEGLFVCHHCDIPRCVRPDHLWLGTCAQNLADCKKKGRNAHGDSAGPRTHPESYPRGATWQEAHPPHTRSRGATHHMRLHPASSQGERNGNAKLNGQQVADIRARYSTGETRAALAREYGLSWNGLNDIVRGKRWPDTSTS